MPTRVINPPTTKLIPEKNAYIFLPDFRNVAIQKNSPIRRKMKDRKKYIAEFLAESEKIIKILEIVL